jgi:GNAT superfamily N-acetyltransferase
MSTADVSAALIVRPLRRDEKAQWQTLFEGYLAFYETILPGEQIDLTWERLHDGAVPMQVLGGFLDDDMVGIAHLIFHPSCWTQRPYCYLQDLFLAAPFRGAGRGRALLDGAIHHAREQGADRLHWLTKQDNATARVLYDRVAGAPSGFIQYRVVF